MKPFLFSMYLLLCSAPAFAYADARDVSNGNLRNELGQKFSQMGEWAKVNSGIGCVVGANTNYPDAPQPETIVSLFKSEFKKRGMLSDFVVHLTNNPGYSLTCFTPYIQETMPIDIAAKEIGNMVRLRQAHNKLANSS